MAFKYYNQNNYGNVPYPSGEKPLATVKSGGCGVCCASMIIENMTAHNISPKLMASYAIRKGARVNGGTDMHRLAHSICSDYGLTCTTTNDENVLQKHLQSGGMATVNVGGNYKGHIGIFSNSGHFVVAAGLANDGRVMVLDPQLYGNKFGIEGRAGKVAVKDNVCYCDISVLTADTANRPTAYWLFSRKDGGITMAQLESWMPEVVAEAKKVGIIKDEHNPLEVVNMATLCAMMLNLMKILKGGTL